MQLDRQDLIDGLREVVRQSHERGITGVSIRIMGGAALRLAHFERATTADIDAQIEPMNQIAPIVEQIGKDRGWSADWLNNEAVGFIPAWGRSVEWEPLLDDERVDLRSSDRCAARNEAQRGPARARHRRHCKALSSQQRRLG